MSRPGVHFSTAAQSCASPPRANEHGCFLEQGAPKSLASGPADVVQHLHGLRRPLARGLSDHGEKMHLLGSTGSCCVKVLALMLTVRRSCRLSALQDIQPRRRRNGEVSCSWMAKVGREEHISRSSAAAGLSHSEAHSQLGSEHFRVDLGPTSSRDTSQKGSGSRCSFRLEGGFVHSQGRFQLHSPTSRVNPVA